MVKVLYFLSESHYEAVGMKGGIKYPMGVASICAPPPIFSYLVTKKNVLFSYSILSRIFQVHFPFRLPRGRGENCDQQKGVSVQVRVWCTNKSLWAV